MSECETLNIDMDNGQIANKSGTLTHIVCGKQT